MLQKLLLVCKFNSMKSISLIVFSLSIILVPCLLLFSGIMNRTHWVSNTEFNLDCLLNNFLSLIPMLRNQISGVEQLESELPWPLFIYPSEYGAEKYLLRRATILANRSCHLYSHSSAAEVLRQIENADFNKNSSLKFLKIEEDRPGSSSMRGNFGGNLNLENRKQYFNMSDGMEMPCGFANYPSPGFRISAADKQVMESCRGLVLISAIFGGYDRLRQPKRVKRITAENVCFFMFVDSVSLEKFAGYGIKPNESHKIGLWRVVLVEDLPYKEHVMNGLIPKYLPHRLFPNCLYTIWMDAKVQLAVDPLLILENLLMKQNAEIALSRHPYNVHTMEEAIFTVRWRKWNKEAVRRQMEHYCAEGLQPWSSKKLPYTTDVGDTALILRKHSNPAKVFSCLVFNEIQVFNPRDQLAFAFVRDMMNPKLKIHMFSADVFNTITNEYRHSVHGSGHLPTVEQGMGIFMAHESTACKSYLDIMWNISLK